MIVPILFLILISATLSDSSAKPPAIVKSIRLSESYLYPASMRSEETCFGNSLTEVKYGQELKVVSTRPFTLFFTTEFSDSYLNMQQYYRENLENITVNAMLLSKLDESNGV
jgi:hypothetical protein